MRFKLGLIVACLLTALPLEAKEWLIDVRTPEEFATEHVSGALNIEYQQIVSGLQLLPGSKHDLVRLYCRSGRRAGLAREALLQAGYPQVENLGSLAEAEAWQASYRLGSGK